MQINPVLKRDMDAIVRNDCERFMASRAKQMTQAQRKHFMNDVVDELKATFDVYGVPYNEDTLKAAMVTLIWSTSATQKMFDLANPVAPENNHPLGIAVHGGLVAIQCVNHAIENATKNFKEGYDG